MLGVLLPDARAAVARKGRRGKIVRPRRGAHGLRRRRGRAPGAISVRIDGKMVDASTTGRVLLSRDRPEGSPLRVVNKVMTRRSSAD